MSNLLDEGSGKQGSHVDTYFLNWLEMILINKNQEGGRK